MLKHKDIAIALLTEAEEDITSAKLLLDGDVYSRSISSSQHAVEKTLKAALVMKDIIITTEHVVSEDFFIAYQDWEESIKIKRVVQTLEREGTKTEYPLFRRTDLPIWMPSKSYAREDAVEALAKAKYVFNTVSEYLRKQYQVGETEEDGEEKREE
ncbi:MAG: HEPN domain-containing protein [bacterium]|nr:HEPN domain-containing protein [bacterium]